MKQITLQSALGADGKALPWGAVAVLVGAVFFLEPRHPDSLGQRAFARDLCGNETMYKQKSYAVQFRYLFETDGVQLQVTSNPYRNPKTENFWMSFADLRAAGGNLSELKVVKI
jgi:hypothetical protein